MAKRTKKRTKKARSNLRFARIPTGNETCGWCFMLSSRGFAYNSESSAMASSHKGCDCIVVPGTKDDTTYEGFDFAEMADRWHSCVETVDNASLERRLRAEWSTMSEAKKLKYHEAISNETRAFLETLEQTEKERMERLGISKAQRDEGAFVRFYQDRLRREALKEAERRDADWLYRGVPSQVSKEPGAKPVDKEKVVIEHLSKRGFAVRFIRERPPVKAPDAYLNGIIWEFKIPESYGEKTVKNQFKKAIGKGTSRLLISLTENKADASSVINDIFKVFDSGEYIEIDEVLVMDADGKISRLNR